MCIQKEEWEKISTEEKGEEAQRTAVRVVA